MTSARGADRNIYTRHLATRRRERQFLASIGFFVAFAVIRVVTHAIRIGIGPFTNVVVAGGGLHIHHLVFGILALLLVGYLWLSDIGTGHVRRNWAFRVTAIAFGVGAALTLDEFALWLNLRDVYWARQGRESIEAGMLFGGLLSATFWGGPLIRAFVYEGRAVARRRGRRRR